MITGTQWMGKLQPNTVGYLIYYHYFVQSWVALMNPPPPLQKQKIFV